MANLPYDPQSEETMVRHFVRSAESLRETRAVDACGVAGAGATPRAANSIVGLDGESLRGGLFRCRKRARKGGAAAHHLLRPAMFQSSRPTNTHSLDDIVEDAALYYPPHISPRIPAQSAVFTVHRHPSVAWQPDSLVRILIEQNTLSMKLDLNACGIHKASLFPDIDGLAQHQAWLHKWGEHMHYSDDAPEVS